jgi:signal transduction histidine kinase
VLAEIAAVACAEVLHASWSATAIVAVQLYTVALLGGRLRSVLIGAVTAVCVTMAILIIDGVDLQGVAARLPLVFLSLAIGDTVRSRNQLRAATAERAARELKEREDEMRRVATAERLQIARELHDTLGHLLVAINVRAGVAVEVPDSPDAAMALQDIKHASAGALRELRSTLTVLREQHDRAPTAPALDLSALPGLVETTRAAGLDAQLEVAVDGGHVPSAIRGAVVRIAQEGLTNVLRHAEASSVRVSIRGTADAVEVEIVDDGTATAAGDAGYGLRGMRERAAALGGRLEAGPCEDGGWRVFARLPLTGGDPR